MHTTNFSPAMWTKTSLCYKTGLRPAKSDLGLGPEAVVLLFVFFW